MSVRVRGWCKRGASLVGALTCLAMMLSLAACGGASDVSPSPSDASASETSAKRTNAGSALILLPDDGITLSQSTPLNKWTKLGGDLVESLVTHGFDEDDIETVKSKTIDEQIDAVDEYVAGHGFQATSDPSGSARETRDTSSGKATIVIAPVADPDDATRQYGDYITQTAEQSDGDRTTKSIKHLASALNAAKKAGVSVVLVANEVEGFTPDAYVRMSTVKEIAYTQATLTASKLALARATSRNPKSIEIMLPASDDETNKEAFAGIWQALGPYFRSGAAISPSGLLDSSSDEGSWSRVVFEAPNQDAAKTEFVHRLDANGESPSHPSIDGVIAMNDMVAAGVTDALADMGYKGSAADINPEITIGGIVGNITGNKDLKKGKVPEPQNNGSSTGERQSPSEKGGTTVGSEDDPAWPIVTGYGVYLSNILQVVNGHQWSTGLENRKQYAEDIAMTVKALNMGDELDTIDGLRLSDTTEMSGRKVPTIHEDIVSVSASNLKKTLIDPGYIRPADAGL